MFKKLSERLGLKQPEISLNDVETLLSTLHPSGRHGLDIEYVRYEIFNCIANKDFADLRIGWEGNYNAKLLVWSKRNKATRMRGYEIDMHSNTEGDSNHDEQKMIQKELLEKLKQLGFPIRGS